MLFRFGKLLCLIILVLAVSSAKASPAVTHQEALLSTSFSDVATTIPSHVTDTIDPAKSSLVALGKEFLQPPPTLTGLSVSQGTVKSLPAVPAALLMVISGFLCVTLVKDRKVWLAVLTGLLWAGQTGIHALPQLATHFGSEKHITRKASTKCFSLYKFESSRRLRGELEGTGYIALLHHLSGIPDSSTSFLQKPETGQVKNKLGASQFAVIRALSGSTLKINCFAAVAEQYLCFSPAFIFQSIPRGPPLLA